MLLRTCISVKQSLIHLLMVAAAVRQGGSGLPASRKDSSTSSQRSWAVGSSWQGMPTKTEGRLSHRSL